MCGSFFNPIQPPVDATAAGPVPDIRPVGSSHDLGCHPTLPQELAPQDHNDCRACSLTLHLLHHHYFQPACPTPPPAGRQTRDWQSVTHLGSCTVPQLLPPLALLPHCCCPEQKQQQRNVDAAAAQVCWQHTCSRVSVQVIQVMHRQHYHSQHTGHDYRDGCCDYKPCCPHDGDSSTSHQAHVGADHGPWQPWRHCSAVLQLHHPLLPCQQQWSAGSHGACLGAAGHSPDALLAPAVAPAAAAAHPAAGTQPGTCCHHDGTTDDIHAGTCCCHDDSAHAAAARLDHTYCWVQYY